MVTHHDAEHSAFGVTEGCAHYSAHSALEPRSPLIVELGARVARDAEG